jgi:DNA invertase Pin-like site-specific DNA recombinase
LVVYKLDRLARSTVKLISVLNDLRDRQVELISISENIDTSTSAGRALFGMLAVFAEFEASVIRERTNAGLAAARARGISFGRTKTDRKVLDKALKLYDARSHTIREISEITGVSRSVLYREIANRGNP